jgi:hypothetical protein
MYIIFGHTGDSDEEILKHTEDVDLKSKETMVFRNNESNALSDCSNEKKCQRPLTYCDLSTF